MRDYRRKDGALVAIGYVLSRKGLVPAAIIVVAAALWFIVLYLLKRANLLMNAVVYLSDASSSDCMYILACGGVLPAVGENIWL